MSWRSSSSCSYYGLFRPKLDPTTLRAVEGLRNGIGIWGRILYGGIAGKGSYVAMWLAILVSGILFGLGHEPSYLAAGCRRTPAFFSTMLVLNLWGSLIFGWRYWQHGSWRPWSPMHSSTSSGGPLMSGSMQSFVPRHPPQADPGPPQSGRQHMQPGATKVRPYNTPGTRRRQHRGHPAEERDLYPPQGRILVAGGARTMHSQGALLEEEDVPMIEGGHK